MDITPTTSNSKVNINPVYMDWVLLTYMVDRLNWSFKLFDDNRIGLSTQFFGELGSEIDDRITALNNVRDALNHRN